MRASYGDVFECMSHMARKAQVGGGIQGRVQAFGCPLAAARMHSNRGNLVGLTQKDTQHVYLGIMSNNVHFKYLCAPNTRQIMCMDRLPQHIGVQGDCQKLLDRQSACHMQDLTRRVAGTQRITCRLGLRKHALEWLARLRARSTLLVGKQMSMFV